VFVIYHCALSPPLHHTLYTILKCSLVSNYMFRLELVIIRFFRLHLNYCIFSIQMMIDDNKTMILYIYIYIYIYTVLYCKLRNRHTTQASQSVKEVPYCCVTISHMHFGYLYKIIDSPKVSTFIQPIHDKSVH
jgi:hypothetical protein